jgi:phage FluMu protein Com
VTIKVQGETYNSAEEVITAIGELGAQLEDLPETHPGRADLARHIERLRNAVTPDGAMGDSESPTPQEAATAAESPVIEGEQQSPSVVEPPEEEAEDDEIPDGFIKCPVCLGGGLLSDEAPVDPDNERCATCNGYGKVLTGSHVQGHEQRDCPTCIGNGYTARRETYTPTENGNTAATAPGWPGATWNADESRWEPPPGNIPWTGAVWDALKGTYS